MHCHSSSNSVPPFTYRRTSFSPRVRVLLSPDPNDRTTMPATNRHLNIFTVLLSLRLSYFTSVFFFFFFFFFFWRKASACLIMLSAKQGSHWYHFVFGMTRPGIESTTSRFRSARSNHYAVGTGTSHIWHFTSMVTFPCKSFR